MNVYFGKVTATITHLKEYLYRIEFVSNAGESRKHGAIEITTSECVHPVMILRDFLAEEAGYIQTMLDYKEVDDNVYKTY